MVQLSHYSVLTMLLDILQHRQDMSHKRNKNEEKSTGGGDRSVSDKSTTNEDKLTSARTSSNQETSDTPEGKKDLQRNINRWSRFTNLLKKRPSKQKDIDKDEKMLNAEKIKNDAVKAAANRDEQKTKNEEKIPDTPSEVSVNQTPEVDGEEAPE